MPLDFHGISREEKDSVHQRSRLLTREFRVVDGVIQHVIVVSEVSPDNIANGQNIFDNIKQYVKYNKVGAARIRRSAKRINNSFTYDMDITGDKRVEDDGLNFEWSVVKRVLLDPSYSLLTLRQISAMTSENLAVVRDVITRHRDEVRVCRAPTDKGENLFTLASKRPTLAEAWHVLRYYLISIKR